jgi:hypothetical protein
MYLFFKDSMLLEIVALLGLSVLACAVLFFLMNAALLLLGQRRQQ